MYAIHDVISINMLYRMNWYMLGLTRQLTGINTHSLRSVQVSITHEFSWPLITREKTDAQFHIEDRGSYPKAVVCRCRMLTTM